LKSKHFGTLSLNLNRSELTTVSPSSMEGNIDARFFHVSNMVNYVGARVCGQLLSDSNFIS